MPTLAEGIELFIAPNPSLMTLDGTRTYLLTLPSVVVVDPGPQDPGHLFSLSEAIGGRPVDIVCTHHHADHSAIADELSRRTGGKIWSWDERAGSVAVRAAEGSVQHREVDPTSRIADGPGGLKLIHTPGHAPDHITIQWPDPTGGSGGSLFVGDLLLGEGDTTLVAAPEGDVAEYLESLKRIEKLSPGRLFPGHGPPIEEPGDAIHRYRQHRLERVQQVRALQKTEPELSADALVTRIYGSALAPGLREAALGSVAAILNYRG